MRCGVCGKEEILPFRCTYCGEYFCPEHRIPETHSCLAIFAVKNPAETQARMKRLEDERVYAVAPSAPLFSRQELQHLLVGVLLVVLVGFTLVLNWVRFPLMVGGFLLGFGASFAVHELAHKFVARRYRLQAEFRIYSLGAVITAISALLPFFKVIAPGAVVISGSATERQMGIIGLAGPVTNIGVAAGLAILGALGAGVPVSVLAELNAFLALFNLIPFGPLDGLKVIRWSPAAWGIFFTASLALVILLRCCI